MTGPLPALCLGLQLLAAPARAQEAQYNLRGLDVYGTAKVTSEQVQERFADELRQYVRARGARSRARGKAASDLDVKADEIKRAIEAGVAKSAGAPWVRLAWMEKASSATAAAQARDVFIIMEVVEAQDMASRLPFRPVSKNHMKDASGLIDAWTQYQETGWRLARKGDISLDRAPCPAFYCTWGSATPELKRYEDKFVAEVPANKKFLAGILDGDADAGCRANSLFLLSYLKDGPEVSTLVSPGLTDPDDRVRDAAMRVYTDIVLHAPDVPIPLETVAGVLDYPFSDDRTRALGLILSMADKPPYRPFLIQRTLDTLIRILHLKEPSNHQLAYAALGLLSGQSLGERDYAAWEDWAHKARLAAQKSPKGPK